MFGATGSNELSTALQEAMEPHDAPPPCIFKGTSPKLSSLLEMRGIGDDFNECYKIDEVAIIEHGHRDRSEICTHPIWLRFNSGATI